MIENAVNRVTYQGDGQAVEFAFTFEVIEKSDVVVVTVSPENVEKTLTSDYFVDMDKKVVRYPGYPPGEEPPEAERPPVLTEGWKLVIYRSIAMTQEESLGDVWPFNLIEDGLDKLTMIVQDMEYNAKRMLKLSAGAPEDVDPTLPIPHANASIYWDNTGKKLVNGENPNLAAARADASAAAALASQNEAKNQADLAKARADQAAQSRDDAAGSKSKAAASAAAALASQNAAHTSEENAADSAALARKWASEPTETVADNLYSARYYAVRASESAGNADDSEAAALASQNAAKVSETNAKTSETNAASSASEAAASATASANSAAAAKASQTAAKTSETNAKTSETNAAASAQHAEEVAGGIGDPVSSVTESNGTVTVTKSSGATNTITTIAKAGKLSTARTINHIPFDGTANILTTTVKNHYARAGLWAPGKRSVTIAPTILHIGDTLYESTANVTLNLDTAASWDTNSVVTPANCAGKDFYIYACTPANGNAPKYILSTKSTVPTGYTADNSRKIGGFHCLCVDVGTIEGHTLSGYKAGDILPASAWDLLHRARSENEGMVYDEMDDVWISIYILSELNGEPASVYGGVMLDGESATPYHGLKFTEELAKKKMRLPYLHEYFNALKGCQERVNVKGSADVNTTGGHIYSNDIRCISNIGLEDPSGVIWQWSNNYGMAGGDSWGNSNYDATVDGGVARGDAYGTLWLPRVGGRWDNGSHCGSRSVNGNNWAAKRNANIAGRGASDTGVCAKSLRLDIQAVPIGAKYTTGNRKG